MMQQGEVSGRELMGYLLSLCMVSGGVRCLWVLVKSLDVGDEDSYVSSWVTNRQAYVLIYLNLKVRA